MIKVGIIGGAGYTAGELIRLLLNHPEAEIVFINSSSNAGNKITDVHEGLYGETDLVFTDQLPLEEIDVLFFCTAHGDTRKFLESHNVPEELRIIDLSMDYRIASPDHDFIYGLPELNRRATCKAKHVANPGCFATCIQLGLLPLAKHLMLNDDIMVNAITGSTGAGVKPGATSHFSWRNNNMSVYKAFEHQHVPEIKQSLRQLQNSFDAEIDFIPYRGDFPRGIFTTIVVKTKVALEEIIRMYEEYYAKDSFTFVVEKNIDLKQVVNTNKCLIHLEKHGDKLLIISCIDNLLKQQYIHRLLRSFPEARELPEHEDYANTPNRQTASALIAQIHEDFIEPMDGRENYLDYVANRPGVKALGEHGLWDANGKVPSLENAVAEVARHTGNVWTPIISLSRENAERLGYTDIKNWQDLINASITDIAKGYKIHPSHLCWYAALHEKEKHIHVHMVLFSTDPKEGYLSRQGIRSIKSIVEKYQGTVSVRVQDGNFVLTILLPIMS